MNNNGAISINVNTLLMVLLENGYDWVISKALRIDCGMEDGTPGPIPVKLYNRHFKNIGEVEDDKSYAVVLCPVISYNKYLKSDPYKVLTPDGIYLDASPSSESLVGFIPYGTDEVFVDTTKYLLYVEENKELEKHQYMGADIDPEEPPAVNSLVYFLHNSKISSGKIVEIDFTKDTVEYKVEVIVEDEEVIGDIKKEYVTFSGDDKVFNDVYCLLNHLWSNGDLYEIKHVKQKVVKRM